MIQEFAFYSSTFTIAEPDDFVPNLPDPAVSSAWRRVLDRVHIVLDEWEGRTTSNLMPAASTPLN